MLSSSRSTRLRRGSTTCICPPGTRPHLITLSATSPARRRETFDLVLFLGVFYHLRHPLLALDLLAEKTERLLVLQTLTMPGSDASITPEDVPFDQREAMLDPGWPKMAFIEHRFADD